MIRERINSFLYIYQKMSESKKAGLWYVICNFFQKGISLITVPIFTRIMTSNQYGVFSVYQSWYSIISIIATLNLWLGVFNNGMLDYKGREKELVSSLQGLCTTVTLVVFLIYCIFQNQANSLLGLSSSMVYAMFVELFAAPAFSLWCSYQRFHFKYRVMVAITLGMSLLAPLLGIMAVLLTEYKAEARIFSFVLVQTIIGLIFYIYNFKEGKKFFSKEMWRYALLYNLPLIPHYLSSVVLTNSDRLMINNMVGADKAAIYSVVYNISAIANLLITAIANAFIPYAYQNIRSKNYHNIKVSSANLVLLVAVMCLVIMLLGPEVISFFAPKEYMEAVWVIPPVIAGTYFFFLYPMFNIIEFYYKKNIYITAASCVGAVLNILLNYIMIPKFGYIAAGYTTLVCYVLFSVSHYYVMRMILKMNNIKEDEMYDIKFLVLVSAFVTIGMLICLVLYRFALMRYFIIAMCILVMIIKRKFIVSVIRDIK